MEHGDTALKHVLGNILGQSATSPAYVCLKPNGINTLFDLLSLDEEFIDNSLKAGKYKDNNGRLQDAPLLPYHRHLFNLLLRWNRHLISENNDMSIFEAQWTSLNSDNWHAFRTGPYTGIKD